MTKILYIHPSSGGIADYARQIEAIYANLGVIIEMVTPGDAKKLTSALAKNFDLVHLEIGAADDAIFELGQDLLTTTSWPQLITIHDTGIIVRHPIPVALADHPNPMLRLIGKIIRKLLEITRGQKRIKRYLSSSRVVVSCLRPDVAQAKGWRYLPQPTYHAHKPAERSVPTGQIKIGFSGYWGIGKGIETLIEAWPLVTQSAELELIIAGGNAGAADAYSARLVATAEKLTPPAQLPGHIEAAKFEDFLGNLGALVLPYWPELPSGTSAMAMRAAELGTPIIASDTPALRGQLGADGAIYVQPKNSTALAEAISWFAQDPKEAFEMAAITQQRLYEKHNWQVVGKALQKIARSAEKLS